MKLKLNKDEHGSLDSALQTHYVEDASGAFVLDIEDMPTKEPQRDDGPLKRAHERTKQELRDARDKLKSFEDKQANSSLNDARKNGDLDTMEKAYNANIEKIKGEFQSTIDSQQAFMKKQLKDNVAIKMASEISDDPDIILPHILNRVDANFDGETPSTRYLDENGDNGFMSYEDLKKEFVENPKFSSIIRGNKASGSGATGSNKSPGDASHKKKFSEMNAAEMGAYERSDPEGFKRDYEKRFNV